VTTLRNTDQVIAEMFACLSHHALGLATTSFPTTQAERDRVGSALSRACRLWPWLEDVPATGAYEPTHAKVADNWDKALWPHACPNCGHESDPMSYWYWPQPCFGSLGFRLGACTECDHLHPVLGKLRPEDFTKTEGT
jgi:hypothetical protein